VAWQGKGWIVAVGGTGSDAHFQFETSEGVSGAFDFSGIEWAYELAKDALLHDKMVRLTSSGDRPDQGTLENLVVLNLHTKAPS
jgi:hypothetical protein